MNTQKKIEEAQEYIRSAEKRCDTFFVAPIFTFIILPLLPLSQFENFPAEVETRLRCGSGRLLESRWVSASDHSLRIDKSIISTSSHCLSNREVL